MELILVLGNQLFDPSRWPENLKGPTTVFMREDRELCTYFRFHKHKIIFFLAAMRAYKDELIDSGRSVHYEELGVDQKSYDDSLAFYIKKNKVKKVYLFEVEDKFFETRILEVFKTLRVDFEVLRSPMFLTSRVGFSDYLKKYKKPFMKNFYEQQRKRFKILVDHEMRPAGGQWSFDEENRLPLPADIFPPDLPSFPKDPHVRAVQKVCDVFFENHPGDVEEFWLPVRRDQAKQWLEDFLKNKLNSFGPYEDALAIHSDFVFHSVLTPFLNTGLLTPQEVI
ncbi:cryptochrome/photolyase family protein [Bdellovibrio svalbardensis]|uniref:Cryptochrome/photolyase family protein n=1 Tax=Bdellovibrio svalbardensis TaxID=2972972 RepID=A0ABT6DP09_9BACT|nr:cryptochrome/photolyase family protein [Bdellovibrio svalbardensis]MDG0817576.1 cryptochrome/photolyase family protein [Bdellovibrio svalbardensis]